MEQNQNPINCHLSIDNEQEYNESIPDGIQVLPQKIQNDFAFASVKVPVVYATLLHLKYLAQQRQICLLTKLQLLSGRLTYVSSVSEALSNQIKLQTQEIRSLKQQAIHTESALEQISEQNTAIKALLIKLSQEKQLQSLENATYSTRANASTAESWPNQWDAANMAQTFTTGQTNYYSNPSYGGTLSYGQPNQTFPAQAYNQTYQ